eukprot:14748269-Ditylum_brightwellii.AAC.1
MNMHLLQIDPNMTNSARCEIGLCLQNNCVLVFMQWCKERILGTCVQRCICSAAGALTVISAQSNVQCQ